MDYAVIKKSGGTSRAAPNLKDYESTRATFHWDDIEKEFEGLPGG